MAFTKEFLTGLGLTDEQTSQVFAERGRDIEKDRAKHEALAAEKQDLQSQLSTLTADKAELERLAGDLDAYKTRVSEFEQREAQRIEAQRKAQEDEVLTAAVLSAVGDKEFVNEWTKSSIVNEIKSKISAGEKDIAKALSELTKDSDGVFKNPNPQVDIPPVGAVSMSISAEDFKGMGYTQRAKLKQEQPETYKTLKAFL